MDATKPFTIAKQQVVVAFKAVTVALKVIKPVRGSFYKGLRNASRGYLFTGSKVWSVRLLDGSGMNREVHVPFCERLGVRFLRPTHRVPQAHRRQVHEELANCA